MSIALELEAQSGSNRYPLLARNFKQVSPPFRGIAAKLLTTDEYNSLMAKRLEVSQDQLCSAAMIKDDIGDAFDRSVPCNRDGRNWIGVFQRRIYSNEALDASAKKHLGIPIN